MIWQSSGCFSASLRITDLHRPCENDKVALISLVINSITFSLQPSIKISFLLCPIIITVLFFGVRSGFALTHFTLLGSPKSPNIFARVIVLQNSFACVIASTNPHSFLSASMPFSHSSRSYQDLQHNLPEHQPPLRSCSVRSVPQRTFQHK